MALSLAELRAQAGLAPVPSPGQGLQLDANGRIPAPLLPFVQGYQIGYDQIVTGATVSSATEATGTTIITCAAHTFDGSLVRAEFFSPFTSVAAADVLIVSLFEGSTQIGRLCAAANPAAATFATPLIGVLPFIPTAGLHTYAVTGKRVTNNWTVQAGASGTGDWGPCFIRFVRV